MVPALGLLAGCHRTDLEGPGGATSEVVMTLDVPETSPATRAIEENDESHIKEIDILVFKDNGNNNAETFLYAQHATTIDNTPNSRKFTASLRLTTGTEKHRIVVFANMGTAVKNALDNKTITINTTKAAAIAAIKIPYPDASNLMGWNATSGTNFSPLPMWGEAESQGITSSTSTIGTIRMVRSLAQIRILVNPTNPNDPQSDAATGFTNFKMTDIYVYRIMEEIQGGPTAENFDANTTIATAPSVPAGAVRREAPLKFKYSGGINTVTRQIYIAESNHKDAPDDKKTCVVIGGSYDGGATTWYRIDFVNNESNSILRNFRYTINIKSINGAGHNTPEIALASKPIGMTVDIIIQNDRTNNIIYDGQNYLSVDKDQMAQYKSTDDAPSTPIVIKTDYVGGWKIANVTGPTNLDKLMEGFSVREGAANTTTTLTYNYYINVTMDAKVEFDIVAGNLKKRIVCNLFGKVAPEGLSELSVPKILYFLKGGGSARLAVTTNVVDVVFEKELGGLSSIDFDNVNSKTKIVRVGAAPANSVGTSLTGETKVTVKALENDVSASVRLLQLLEDFKGNIKIVDPNNQDKDVTGQNLAWNQEKFRTRAYDVTGQGVFYVVKRLVNPGVVVNDRYWQPRNNGDGYNHFINGTDPVSGEVTSSRNLSYDAPRDVCTIQLFPAQDANTVDQVKLSAAITPLNGTNTLTPLKSYTIKQDPKQKPTVTCTNINTIPKIKHNQNSTTITFSVNTNASPVVRPESDEITSYTWKRTSGNLDMIKATEFTATSNAAGDASMEIRFNYNRGNGNREVYGMATASGYNNSPISTNQLFTFTQTAAGEPNPGGLKVTANGSSPITYTNNVFTIPVTFDAAGKNVYVVKFENMTGANYWRPIVTMPDFKSYSSGISGNAPFTMDPNQTFISPETTAEPAQSSQISFKVKPTAGNARPTIPKGGYADYVYEIDMFNTSFTGADVIAKRKVVLRFLAQ